MSKAKQQSEIVVREAYNWRSEPDRKKCYAREAELKARGLRVTVRRPNYGTQLYLTASRLIEDTRSQGECQVCANVQCLDAKGRLVLHGYKRPGIGISLGRCPGTGALPMPAHDVIEDLLNLSVKALWSARRRLEAMDEVQVILRYRIEIKHGHRTPAHLLEWVKNTPANVQASIDAAEPSRQEVTQDRMWSPPPRQTVAGVIERSTALRRQQVAEGEAWLGHLQARLSRAVSWSDLQPPR